MAVRAKFRVAQTTQFPRNDHGNRTLLVELRAINGPEGSENADWSKYTPAGEIKLTITNPEASAQFEAGDYWYLTFTKAES
jgi:hypothetical protein